jgi:hypothetical protein
LMPGVASGQTEGSQGTPPAAGLTNPQAIGAFGMAIMNCLQSRLSSQTIADLADGAAIRVRAAPTQDRWLAGPHTSVDTPVWITDELGGLMTIIERSPERCEITAIQLPVERTFRTVIYALQQTRPDFAPVHVEPGYNPIVYQLESVGGGVRYIIHMEGAEPGEPGHALRFSLINAWVERQAADAQDSSSSVPPS